MSEAILDGRERPRKHIRRTADGLLPADESYRSITDEVAGAVFRPAGKVWWWLFAASAVGVVVMIVAMVVLFYEGIGIWGVNTSVVWGFAIADYVWWIGIGNAGTLISSMLLLTRQHWRASINRYAEAMTLFAAAIAGLYPIMHLGRPYFAYWLAPYPNIMTLWPQWRSPLVWDMFAIASYIIFSLLFWYTGLIPDLATMRDRARGRFAQVMYGIFALGWQGSSRQWKNFNAYYYAMAALGVPLVVSVHSVVGLDYAATLMPGWQETIFPPYFVVGAMFSGFAMVVTLTIPIRWGLRLERVITLAHLDAMAKILLMGSIVMGFSYAMEWFTAWYGGDPVERYLTWFEFFGSYGWIYWIMLACNCVVGHAFWFRRVRRNVKLLFVIATLINVGMWLERVLINMNTLSRGHLPSQWSFYDPTIWEWAMFLGTFGLFCFLFFVFARFIPAASIHEIRQLAHEEGTAK